MKVRNQPKLRRVQHCMTDRRINNPLSSFENKQRRFSNIKLYGILYIFYNILVIITGLYQVTL